MTELIIDNTNKNDYMNDIYLNVTKLFWFRSAGYLEEQVLINFPNLTELYCCFNRQITDLDAIKHCSNLRVLACSFNNISSLEPLIHCKQLKELYCADNNISDLSPIKNCSELTHLECTDNPIVNYGDNIKLVTKYLNKLCWAQMSNNNHYIDIFTKEDIVLYYKSQSQVQINNKSNSINKQIIRRKIEV